MHDAEFLRQNVNTKPEVFPRGSLRYLVGLALSHWKANKQPLSKTVVEMATEHDTSALRRAGAEKQQARTVFADCDEVYAVTDADLPAVRRLARLWLERRQMLVSIEKAADAAEQGDLSEARAHLDTSVLRTNDRGGSLSLRLNADDVLVAGQQTVTDAVPTGIPELDKLWVGGSRKGELGMIVAPTGVGKSMGLCAIAAQAVWAGWDVLYYTFELTPPQILERIILAVLEKGRHDIKSSYADELNIAARRRHQAVPSADIDVRGETMTWPDLMSDLEDYKDQHGKYPDVLLLDSADDIAPLQKRAAGWEQLREAFTFLRMEIAIAKDICVWTSGQLTRDAVEKARVSLRNIGDAFAKAQKSHYVLGLSQTQQDREDIDGPMMNLYVLKDSLHGTAGGWLKCAVMFGHGDNGYPGFEVRQTYGLKV